MCIRDSNYAVEMACFMKADLSLVHICLLPMTYGEMPYSLENTDSLVTDAEEKILRIKNDLSVKCGGKVNIITEIKMAFTVIGELANYCSSKKPYAVVMGTPVSYTHLRAHETPEHLVCR